MSGFGEFFDGDGGAALGVHGPNRLTTLHTARTVFQHQQDARDMFGMISMVKFKLHLQVTFSGWKGRFAHRLSI